MAELGGVDTDVVRGVFPPGVVESPSLKGVRRRRGVELIGIGTSTRFIIHNNSYANLRRALIERVYNVEAEIDGQKVLQPPPQPVPGIFPLRLHGLAIQLTRALGARTPMSREEFVASRPAFKRKVYEVGLESLYAKPIAYSDSRIDGAFVKCEKINSKKGDPAPRIIQPRTVRYNIEVGRYLAVVEHDIYHALDELWGGPTVMKNMNADEVGDAIHKAWSTFSEPVAVGFDASRFDQHVSAAALLFEHSIYNELFNSDELASLLMQQIVNRGLARADDGDIKYTKVGSRMSGDMNTSLGNVILMVLMMLWFCQHVGLRARLINNGDDCVLIFEARDLHLIESITQRFLEFGFTLTQEPVARYIEHIEFCQCRPVRIGCGYRMVRNVVVSMSKDAVSRRPRTPVELRQWMHCVGSSGCALTSCLPVVFEYYEFIRRHGLRGAKWDQVEERNGLYWMSKNISMLDHVISPETRSSFELAFDIPVCTQLALEQYFRELVWSPDELPRFSIYI